ncbi:fluoride efflux transporter CrcB [Paenibacillus gallinarum]|uniref:Fluoride-specific ion channel FluC n=1 Tax=Paenibacillus gallinarum TaxID=2762232 RepID=A0ABR8SVA0_9BACL|nr:fluoride efflux transporter CrcB [Paenibacillus gallinarum]MBD7967433.1 fluoride efflux transporter CrcB [Paenibacillus gallinarum]
MIWLAGLGGIAGAIMRYTLGRYIMKRAGGQSPHPFPLGTWVINISGSFLLGLLFGLSKAELLTSLWWALLGVGFCGAYTTFSTFGYETMQLITANKLRKACLYVISSVTLGLIAAWFGIWVVGIFIHKG